MSPRKAYKRKLSSTGEFRMEGIVADLLNCWNLLLLPGYCFTQNNVYESFRSNNEIMFCCNIHSRGNTASVLISCIPVSNVTYYYIKEGKSSWPLIFSANSLFHL